MKSMLYNLLVLCCLIGHSQNELKTITPEEYNLWSTLSHENISADGNWFTYKLTYTTADTIFVQNTKSKLKYPFPLAKEGIFSQNSTFFMLTDKAKATAILNLKTGNLLRFSNTIRQQFFLDGKYAALLETGKELKIIELATQNTHTIPKVLDFNISKDGKIAILTQGRIDLVMPNESYKTKSIVIDSTGVFQKFLWCSDGTTLAFLKQQPSDKKNNLIYYYNFNSDTLKILDPLKSPKLHSQSIVTSFSPLVLSDNGDKVYFYYAGKPQPLEEDLVEVWDALSSLEYPRQIFQGNPETIPKLASWNPENDSIVFIGTNQSPNVILNANRKFAISYNTLAYEPQAEYRGPADYFITNLQTGASHLILKNQTTNDGFTGNSPKGNYFHYFKESDWWVYDLTKNTHLNLTKGLDTNFVDLDNDYPDPSYGYISPGWTSDDKALIVYDKYDIWLLSADGKSKNRITNGREKKIRFRIADDLAPKIRAQGTADIIIREFELAKGLIIEAVGEDFKSGYFRWTLKKKLQELIYQDSKMNHLKSSLNTVNGIIIEQKASVPPALKLLNLESGKSSLLLQTNQQYTKFKTDRVEMIHYKTVKDQNLHGILYYPSNFQIGKKYPMLVYIYSRQSKYFHEYNNPTLYSTVGFSPTNYTSDGYFVLYPDISYVLGEPGKSALNCVEAAISMVEKKGMVDSNKMGIIGHSFGGFEVDYIITQTNRFAAAVSGAAVTDFTSSYLSINLYSGYSNAWRYETQQYRMGKSLFENQEQYLNNSPVLLASQITTPLLSWSGKEDTSVDWHQNLELHLAMRKLKKTNLFLVYPGQDHTLSNPESQKDLTTRIKKWFDYYLKSTN